MDIKFQSASRTTMGDEVFNQFIQLLGNGVYKPGEKLPTEIEMCRQLGVSRPVLREVTRALCHMGYLNSVQGGGTYVCKLIDPMISNIKIKLALKKVQLMEVWELRYIIESTVAGIAAERATEEERSCIRRAMEDYVNNVRKQVDESLIIAASQSFHHAIARAAHNEVLLDVLESVSNVLSMSREATIKVDGSNDRAVQYHTKIAFAIAARDSQEAKRVMEEHLLDVKEDLLIYLEKEEGLD